MNLLLMAQVYSITQSLITQSLVKYHMYMDYAYMIYTKRSEMRQLKKWCAHACKATMHILFKFSQLIEFISLLLINPSEEL